MQYVKMFISVVLAGALAACSGGKADLAFTGGKIATVDEAFTVAEAVAIKDGKFIYVGCGFSIML